MLTRKQLVDKLQMVVDPELGMNIVDLGFIYQITVKKNKAMIKMTFTTPACPMINNMLQEIKDRLDEIPDADIEVVVVFDPPWTPERMTKKARIKLGMI